MNARVLLLILGVLSSLRLAAAAFGPVTGAEAYLLMVAQRWDWAYFEGPGGFPAILLATTELLGANPIALRLPGIIFAAAGAWMLFLLAGAVCNERAAFWAALAWSVLPVVNETAVTTSPLPAAVFFWLAFWLLAWNAVHTKRAAHWLAAGGVLALGVFTDYTLLLAIAGLLLWLAASPKHRRGLLRPWPWLTVLIGLAGLIGPVLWNRANDWIAFAGETRAVFFQFGGTASLEALWLGIAALSAAAMLVAATACALGVTSWRRSNSARFVCAASLPCFLAWVFGIYRGWDWTAPLTLAAPLLLLYAAGRILADHKNETTAMRPAAIAGSVALALMGIQTAATFALAPPWRGAMEHADAARQLRAAADELPAEIRERIFFIAAETALAAALNYHMSDAATGTERRPEVFVRESQNLTSQFGLWPRYDEFIDGASDDPFFTEQQGRNPYMGRPAIYAGPEDPDSLPQAIDAAFTEVTLLGQLHADDAADPLYFYLCMDYQTLPL